MNRFPEFDYDTACDLIKARIHERPRCAAHTAHGVQCWKAPGHRGPCVYELIAPTIGAHMTPITRNGMLPALIRLAGYVSR